MLSYDKMRPIAFVVCLLLNACCFVPVSAESLPPAPEGTFSIVVIPDTQQYRSTPTTDDADSPATVTNPVFAAHVRWISENLEAQRIAFVSHVGDIVDKNRDDQWQVARQCMDVLHGRVPYGISVGNHDMTRDGDSSRFQHYFPAARFTDFPWYGGYYPGQPDTPHISGNNANSYALFSAAGEDFIFLHLECNAPDDVLEWANVLLAEHADRHAFITTHMGLGPLEHPTENRGYFDDPKGRMRWAKIHGPRGNSPQQMWDKCFRKHANVKLIFCGDQSRTSALHLAEEGDHGQTIHTLLSDYTSSGPLRVYRIHPAEEKVDVITFDTTKQTLVEATDNVPEREQHQFALPVNFGSTVSSEGN